MKVPEMMLPSIVEPQVFRDGMSLVPGAICVITTEGETGMFGFTATAMCSLSDNPPTLLVCVNKKTRAHDHILANQHVAVNVLASSQSELCKIFSDKNLDSEARFAQALWYRDKSGSPLLKGANIVFDCIVKKVVEEETHTIVIGRVCDVIFSSEPANSLVWYRKKCIEVL